MSLAFFDKIRALNYILMVFILFLFKQNSRSALYKACRVEVQKFRRIWIGRVPRFKTKKKLGYVSLTMLEKMTVEIFVRKTIFWPIATFWSKTPPIKGIQKPKPYQKASLMVGFQSPKYGAKKKFRC